MKKKTYWWSVGQCFVKYVKLHANYWQSCFSDIAQLIPHISSLLLASSKVKNVFFKSSLELCLKNRFSKDAPLCEKWLTWFTQTYLRPREVANKVLTGWGGGNIAHPVLKGWGWLGGGGKGGNSRMKNSFLLLLLLPLLSVETATSLG